MTILAAVRDMQASGKIAARLLKEKYQEADRFMINSFACVRSLLP